MGVEGGRIEVVIVFGNAVSMVGLLAFWVDGARYIHVPREGATTNLAL